MLILVVTGMAYSRLPGNRESGIFDTDPPTPYFHYSPTGALRGRVLVVHGLDSAKNVMNIISFGLADAGFEVFSMDLPGHGESRAGFNAIQARRTVESVLDTLGPGTAVLGHSLGGGLLLDMAIEHPVGRMVLFSPAPIPLRPLRVEHLLVLEGQFDPGRIRAFVPQIEDNSTGTFAFRELAWTAHSGGLFRASVIAYVAGWLGGDVTSLHTTKRLLFLVLTVLSSTALGLTLLAGIKRALPATGPARTSARVCVLYYTIAPLVAAGVLAIVKVTAWLRIFAMDYLIGVAFVAGILLLCCCRRQTLSSPRLWVGVAAAAYVIVVMGGFAGSELVHTLVSGGRWWRFPAILVLSLPLFLSDEYLLRPLSPAWKAAAAAFLSRIVIGAVAVSGALILNRQAAFLLLLAHLVVLFWIALWFAAGAVRARSDGFTAACFAAIVQAWFFAAIFVTV